MFMHDKYGRAVTLGVRHAGPVTARARSGEVKPLPLELMVLPQRATKRRLKGRPEVPEGYGLVRNPSNAVMRVLASDPTKGLELLRTTGRYALVMDDGTVVGRCDRAEFVIGLAALMGGCRVEEG